MKFQTKIIALVALAFMAVNTLSAQEFMEPSYGVSPKKIAYITMEDGTTQEVFVRTYKTKKGLIEEITVRDKDDNKVKLDPEQIKHMYLPQSGWSKFAESMEFLNDATKWDNEEINAELIKDGYVYYEKAEVQLKKSKITAMLQLLNPSFCSKIRVYDDPFAGETFAPTVGGIQVAESYAKSHYVKVGDAVAYRLEKSDYDEGFTKLFGDCPAVKKEYGKDKSWKKFASAMFAHTNCEKE